MITLTKIKLAGGEETPRFEAQVCWQGKPVGVATNGGTGGPCRVWWGVARKGAPDGFVVTPKATIDAVLREAARLAKRAEPDLFSDLDPDQVEPPVYIASWEEAMSFVLVHEIVLSRHIKALDRACKSRVLTRCPGQAEGAYYTIGVPPTPAEIAAVRRRYPGHVVLNELPSRERAERIMRAEPAEEANPNDLISDRRDRGLRDDGTRP